jgi:DMSO/TMAO reductase YedYZ molybdopterin-dependent catalytic subunit
MSAALELVAVRSQALWVQATFEEFSLPLPLDRARNASLALMLNENPIPVEHGAPVRLLVPDGECFTSVKWLEHLELRSSPAANTAEAIARARAGATVTGAADREER